MNLRYTERSHTELVHGGKHRHWEARQKKPQLSIIQLMLHRRVIDLP